MNLQRQAAMVKSVAKNMRANERSQAQKEKMKSKLYSILKKVGKALDEIKKDDLVKKDYEFIVEYVKNIMQCPLEFYPNLEALD